MSEPKKKRTTPYHPPGSPWISTPDAKRHTKRAQFSIAPDVEEKIDEMAPDYASGRSGVVEDAVRQLHARRSKSGGS
jgi:hypothetical protein